MSTILIIVGIVVLLVVAGLIGLYLYIKSWTPK